MPRYFISTAIPYVTDAPHVGHAYEAVVTDAMARWHRLIGDEVWHVTGTDEHGLKVARAAEEAGVDAEAHAAVNAERYREAYKRLGIANDDFVRTTEPRHHAAVQKFLQKIYDNGDIERGTYEGPYCVSCEAYYTDDELLEGGLCPVHERPVEHFVEENYFFKLSRYEQRLIDWIESGDVIQPASRRNEALGIIRQGLRDVSITRTSITWGVPAPWDPEHVIYVWYDALINYVTSIGYGVDGSDWESWWSDSNHVIGKDIIRFHTVYWPAMLMAAGYDPPAHVWVHGFLLVGGEKMSKTKLNQIGPLPLIDDFGVDGTRWYFLREYPFGPDGDFSWEAMLARYNSDLANNLGNLLSRVATVVGSKCGGVAPAPRADSPLQPVAAECVTATVDAWTRFAPNEALEATWRLVREANAYLESNEPWKAEPGDAVDAVLGDALEVLRIVALLASPAIPSTSRAIWQRLGLEGDPADQRVPTAAVWGQYPGGLPIEKAAPLFPRKTA